MMIETQIPNLPPGLSGDPLYILTLTIDEILWELESQPVQVRVKWWGQKAEDAQIFTPVDVENFRKSKIGDVLFVRYEINTSIGKFTEYLKDASPLNVEVVDHNDQIVGSTFVQNLEKITDSSCGLEGYFPVFNDSSKEIIANIRIQLILETIEAYKENISKTTITNKKVIRSHSPSKNIKSKDVTSKVKFCDGKSKSYGARRSNSPPKRHSSGSSSKAPLADSIVSELLNQSQELRKSMQDKLASNFGSYVADKDDSCRVTEPKSIPREMIPSWNLPVERMRVLACVSKFEITISSVQLNPVILDKLMHRTSKSKPRDAGSMSFFVKYKLPGDGEEASLCTRKMKGNFAEFNEKRTLPITFTSETLEEWWNFKTDFKVYSRHLGQRVPLLMGEATLGMKYLLLHDRYTGGAPLSLPVYVSNSLFRDLKLPTNSSEIIGNVHLSVQLAYKGTVKSRHNSQESIFNSNNEKVTDSEVNVSDANTNDAEPNSAPIPPVSDSNEEIGLPESNVPTSTSARKVINSRPRKERPPVFSNTLYLELRVSVADPYDVFHIKHRNLDMCEGDVSAGQDLVVTSILFLSGDQNAVHNRLMLSRLSQNYLIIQVWRKDQLVGIAKVETNSIYESYKDGELECNKCLSFYDGPINVVDIFEGQSVAELNVRVRVGSDKFISAPTDQVNTSTLCHQNDKQNDNSKSVQTSFLDCPDVDATSKNDGKCDDNTDMNHNVCQTDLPSQNNENGTIKVEIRIEEARNLPFLKSKGGKVVPKVYVTLLEHTSNLYTDIKEDTCPVWNYQQITDIDYQYILNPRKFLILKVWHHRGKIGETRNAEVDQVLGYVAIDLTPLVLASFTCVVGWYNITDWLGKCRGQINVSVTPLQNVDKTNYCAFNQTTEEELLESSNIKTGHLDYYATAQYERYPCHLLNHKELLISARDRSTPVQKHDRSPDLSLVSDYSQMPQALSSYWKEPDTKMSAGSASISMLERTLHSHLTDLNNLTQKFIHHSNGGAAATDLLDDSNSDSSSSRKTFTIGKDDSVIEVEHNEEDLINLHTTEQVLHKKLDDLRNFMKQGLATQSLHPESGRSSRTSLVSEDLPRDDHPHLMDLTPVLHHQDNILDLDSEKSK